MIESRRFHNNKRSCNDIKASINPFNRQLFQKPPSSNFRFNIANIQTKLKVSQPGDIYEQEADRMAEQVMNTNFYTLPGLRNERIHLGYEKMDRKCYSCEMEHKMEEDEKELKISRIPTNNSEKTELSDIQTESVDSVLRETGRPLDKQTQNYMESRFGYDFTNVRIHTDDKASMSAKRINALSYAVGKDIVFGEGLYSPDTRNGKRLLAHELTHVMQQASDSEKIFNKRTTSSNSIGNYNEYLNNSPNILTAHTGIFRQEIDAGSSQSDTMDAGTKGGEPLPGGVRTPPPPYTIPPDPGSKAMSASFNGTELIVNKNYVVQSCSAFTDSSAPTPKGRYCIRRQGEAQIFGGLKGLLRKITGRGSHNWYLLEPQFTTKRSRMMIHFGTMSSGCITVRDSDCFDRLSTFLNSSGSEQGFGYDGYPPGNEDKVDNKRKSVDCIGWLDVI